MILTPLTGYVLVLISCILATFSASSLVGQWVCLEVNMLCIIPILVYSMTEDSILTSVKYFISQSVASLLFVLGLFLFGELSVGVTFMTLMILFKLGLPPMQSWLMSMLPTMGNMSMYLIFTVQKIIPLVIMSFLKISPMIMMLVLSGCLLFMMSSLSQTSSIPMLMFLSSVVNGAWVLSNVGVGGRWAMFMSVYSLILLSVMLCLSKMGVNKVGDLAGVSLFSGLLLSLQFLNLGGLPPLLGFLIKLMMMKQLSSLSFLYLGGLVFMSLLMLFIYTTFAHQSYCFNSSQRLDKVEGVSVGLALCTLMASGLGLFYLI